MYKYAQEGNTESVIRITDGKLIRIVDTDPLYKAVKLWMSRGNTPLPADPEVIEPAPDPIITTTEDPKDKDYAESTDQQSKKKTKKWREVLEKS